MDVDLALLCDAATVDASGKLNILGIFDRINASSFPARHGRLALVLRFRGAVNEVGEHELLITLNDPEGEELVRADGRMNVGAAAGAARGGVRIPQILNFDGLVFRRDGTYVFDVKVDGDHHAAIPLEVTKAAGAQA